MGGGRRKRAAQIKWGYRRMNPTEFPEVCPICEPQRRFKKPNHKNQHDKMKHGEYVSGSVPRRDLFNDYSLVTTTSSSFSPRDSTGSSTLYNRAARQHCDTITPIQCNPDSPLYDLSPDKLNQFVIDEIEPDTKYNDGCSKVVRRLVQFMENNFPADLLPNEILKSGSLGKGTQVKGKSDGDLLVFLANPVYNSIPKLRHYLPTILKKMKHFLEDYGNCEVEGTTSHAVKISIPCNDGHSHDVDILPSVNILEEHALRKVYTDMRNGSRSDLEFYSAALAPLQLAFVSQRPSKLKTLIRLIKFWRKTSFTESTGMKRLPSSYPLELITIGEWMDAGQPENFDLRKGFHCVLKALVNYRSIRQLWTTNYQRSDVDSGLLATHYVMDPANPFNNVMAACNCWDEVADVAQLCLRKPLFDGLTKPVNWSL